MNNQHHSLGDWDYRVGAFLELTNTYFKSPPTSLRTQHTGVGGKIENIYKSVIIAPCVPDGRIITSMLVTAAVGLGATILFRVQDPVYTTIPDDCYRVIITRPILRLRKMVGGVFEELATYDFAPDLSINTWYRFRVTFYQYIKADFHRYLKTLVDWEVAGEWVNIIDFDDPDNNWAESEVNRLGFGLGASNDPSYTHIDDSEIWEKAT